MRKITFLFFLMSLPLFSQWQADFRLTNHSGNSYMPSNSQRSIIAEGQNIHVVWYDAFIGNYLIFYRRSTDGGTTWRQDTNLILTNYEATKPTIAVSGNYLHVAWVDRRIGNDEVYYKYSTNGGISWGPDIRMTDNVYNSQQPSIDASGQNVVLMWDDNISGNYEIYYKRSTDAGLTWGADTRLTNFAGSSLNPAVKIQGSNVYAVWDDGRNGANTEIYFNRSTDYGVTWQADTRLTNFAEPSRNASFSVSGNMLHIVWEDYRAGNAEIYYKNSTDGGTTWSSDMRITNNSSNSWHPSVFAVDSHIHIAWEDNRDGNYEIYYNVSSNSGTSWGTDTRLTNAADNSNYPNITVSDSKVHVVWHDYRDGNFEVYYKQNPTGNTIGITNIGSQIPANYSLSQNYPNPFNPATNIKFSIPVNTNVKLAVFDVLGREVERLVNGILKAGIYTADWIASDHPNGIYFYRLVTDDFSEVKKMILLK